MSKNNNISDFHRSLFRKGWRDSEKLTEPARSVESYLFGFREGQKYYAKEAENEMKWEKAFEIGWDAAISGEESQHYDNLSEIQKSELDYEGWKDGYDNAHDWLIRSSKSKCPCVCGYDMEQDSTDSRKWICTDPTNEGQEYMIVHDTYVTFYSMFAPPRNHEWPTWLKAEGDSNASN